MSDTVERLRAASGPDWSDHPGQILREALQAQGLTQAALAWMLQRPPQMISEIVGGKKAITADTALDLQRGLGISAEFWVHAQAQHDLQVARRRLRGVRMGTNDLISRLRSALDSAERQARDALIHHGDSGDWMAEYHDTGHRVLAGVAASGRQLLVADRLGSQDAEHIARWDPSTVLKLIQRDRALLARFDAVRDADSAWSQTEFLYQEITHAAEFWLSQEGE